MSFWQTSDNQSAAQTGGEFETGGGDMTPIPSNTRLKAMIDDAKWDEYDGDRFVSLRWTVLAPETYKNRKIFQKVRVYDQKTEKADKHKRMLAAIDANAGGNLANQDKEPSDMDLQSALVSKPMLIEVQVWKIDANQSSDGQERSGNWVSKVSPASGGEPSAAPAQKQESEGDDVPF